MSNKNQRTNLSSRSDVQNELVFSSFALVKYFLSVLLEVHANLGGFKKRNYYLNMYHYNLNQQALEEDFNTFKDDTTRKLEVMEKKINDLMYRIWITLPSPQEPRTWITWSERRYRMSRYSRRCRISALLARECQEFLGLHA